MFILGLVVTLQAFFSIGHAFDSEYVCVSGTPSSQVESIRWDGTYRRMKNMFNDEYVYRDTSSTYDHYLFYSNETTDTNPSTGQCDFIQYLDVTASNCWCFDIDAPGDDYFCEVFAPVNSSDTTMGLTFYSDGGQAYTNFTVTAGQCESELNATYICASGSQTDRPINIYWDGTYEMTNYTLDGVNIYAHTEYQWFFYFVANGSECSPRLAGTGLSCWCFATVPGNSSQCNLYGAVYNISTLPNEVSPSLLGWRDYTGFDEWTNFEVSIGECDFTPTGVQEPNATIDADAMCVSGPYVNGTYWNGTYERQPAFSFNAEYVYSIGGIDEPIRDVTQIFWLTAATINESCGGLVGKTAAPDADYCWCFDGTSSGFAGFFCKVFTPVVDFSYTPFNPQYPWYDPQGNELPTFNVEERYCEGDSADPTMSPVTPDPTVANPNPTVATTDPTMMPSMNPTRTRNPSMSPTMTTSNPTKPPTMVNETDPNNDASSIFKNGLLIFTFIACVVTLNI